MTDDSMRQSMDESIYDQWIADRRTAEPSGELVDQVMAVVETRESDASDNSRVRLPDRLNESLPARWAACVAALLVGSLPFWFVASAAKLLEN